MVLRLEYNSVPRCIASDGVVAGFCALLRSRATCRTRRPLGSFPSLTCGTCLLGRCRFANGTGRTSVGTQKPKDVQACDFEMRLASVGQESSARSVAQLVYFTLRRRPPDVSGQLFTFVTRCGLALVSFVTDVFPGAALADRTLRRCARCGAQCPR
uniref:Uncharacterized protein n=1 Tax=Trichuris muris TaxID=70415 RepID=A0A5S6QZ29_TRIMR